MSCNSCEIKRHEHCECYTLLVDGEFRGNFDSVAEAAKEFEEIYRENEAKACAKEVLLAQ